MATIVKNYQDSLSQQLKELYMTKLLQINKTDPYCKKWNDLNKNLDLLPSVSYEMMMDFFMFRVSPETQQEIRAHKSLQAYIQFACKWIKDVRYFKVEERFVIVGKVAHSQKLNDPPLCPWIIQSSLGEIIETYCNCVAGFGTVCTHVASILFALEHASTNMESNKSVTDVLAYWIGPSKKGEFNKTLKEIDFKHPKWKLENRSSTSEEEFSAISSSEDEIPPLSQEETTAFLQKCKDNKERLALFGIMEGFSDERVVIHNPLVELYNPTHENLSLDKLRELAQQINIVLSQEICDAIKEATTKQSRSKKWFYHRTGRITASIFKSVCRTNCEKPSITLVRTICYPVSCKTLFRATEYGCRHEKTALTSYLTQHRLQHPPATLQQTGLIIHPNFPFFGATPDSILICPECENSACVEVKCPYCARDKSIQQWAQWKKTCLVYIEDKLQLDTNHSYYYQTQMQMALTNLPFCDFVVWTKEETFIQRTEMNTEFWAEHSQKAMQFVRTVVLPELLGKYFTNKVAKEKEITKKYSIDEPDS